MSLGRSHEFNFRFFIVTLVIAIGIIAISLFVLFQARYLIIGPQIVLTTEPDSQQNERRIFLEGNAYNISHLWLNDRQIFTDAQGQFKEALILENGYTVATLRAEDRYGRSTTITRELVYAPASFIE